MGNNCGSIQNPNTENLCAVSVGEQSRTMPGFCTWAGPAGNGYRSEYCSKMSSAGEWGRHVESEICDYNSCQPFQRMDKGCCRGCCGIVGGGLACHRLSFKGDPVTCCFKDMECTNNDPTANPPQCFSDPGKQQTCADGKNGQPNYRSLVSEDCQDVLFQYCTGTLPNDDPNSTAWLDRWTQPGTFGSCSYALQRNLFRGANPCLPTIPSGPTGICNIPPPLPLDSEGYFWAQRLVAAAMTRYEEQGFQIGALPGFPGFNPWQDFMYSNICCPYPGLCQDSLERICATQTAQRISLNPAVAQWCGCHLPPEEYQEYSVKFNIPPQCSPTCNRAGTIPIVGINAEPITCQQNICLIDGITINLVNAQIGGDIEFDQICGNCGGTQCSCIVSDTTIDISNGTIGGNFIPVAQGCGSITCSQTNPGITGPATLTVQCGTGTVNPYTEFEEAKAAAEAEAKKNAWLWTLIAIGVAIVLIYLIIVVIHPVMG